MGTLTGLMHTVTSALAADQSAIAATAQNISNQNTVGYTRRNVTWSEGDVVSVGAGTSAGVTATVIAQRDRVLQRSVQNATETASASSARLTHLNQLQDLFKIGATGEDAAWIGSAVSGLFNAASALASTPNSGTAKTALFQSASNLANAFNRVAKQISSQTEAVNQQVSSSVAQVNTLTAQVAALNRQIAGTLPGESRDALLDQRSSAITQLSGLMDVNTVQTERDGVNLTLSDGTALVSGTSQMQLSTGSVSSTVRIFSAQSTGGADVTSAIRGGSIGGALQVRDSDIPEVTEQLDAMASAIATAVNTQNAAGTTASGTAGIAIFSGTSAATLTVAAVNADAFATTGADGVNGSNMQALGKLQDSGIVAGNSPSAALSALLTGLGGTVAGVQTQSNADTAIVSQTAAQLDAVSGVSLDQEAANLTQYQRSYEAAAKVLSIVNELLAQAINLGQPTTVA